MVPTDRYDCIKQNVAILCICSIIIELMHHFLASHYYQCPASFVIYIMFHSKRTNAGINKAFFFLLEKKLIQIEQKQKK